MTKSKWLDWKPETGSVGFEGSDPVGNSIIEAVEGDVAPVPAVPADTIIEETAHGEPTKPTELDFVGFEGVTTIPSSIPIERSDPYAALMERALSKINRPDDPAGMILWLDQAAPGLYAELTSRIPDEVDRRWNNLGPVDEFAATLDRPVAVHREACRLCREDQARRKMEVIGHSEPKAR